MEAQNPRETTEKTPVVARVADDLRLQLMLASMELRDWSGRQSERWHNLRANVIVPAANVAWKELGAAVDHLDDAYGPKTARH